VAISASQLEREAKLEANMGKGESTSRSRAFNTNVLLELHVYCTPVTFKVRLGMGSDTGLVFAAKRSEKAMRMR
jgi:hypothetical protein